MLEEYINDETKKIRSNAIAEVSKKLEYKFPQDYCDYYIMQTTLHIKPNLFKVDDQEKIIRYLFSMEGNNKTYIMNFQKFDSEYEKELVPFAELEFGDILCFNRKDDSIVYYNHEKDTITSVASNWTTFIEMLYE